jgi:hypothetical protein
LNLIHSDYRRTALERIAYQEQQIEGCKAITEIAVKALEFYAEPDTYDREHLSQYGYIIIDKDNGEIARQALKGVAHE